MSSFKERMEEELGRLRTLRDELRVQMHLAGAELSERWDRAEKSWHELEKKVETAAREAAEPAKDVAAAAKLLAEEIGEAYRHIAKTLRK